MTSFVFDVSALLNWTPKVGDLVMNFGVVARVVASDPQRGLTLRCLKTGQKWLADPAKCRPTA